MEPAKDLGTEYLLSSPVSDLSKVCLARFHEIVRICSSDDDTELLQCRIADFKLWADGVGALAKPGLSLDKRFEHRQHDLALIKNILIMLAQFLDDVISEVVIDGSHKTLDNVDSSIKNLAMIGMAIRSTGKASRRRRADESFNPIDYQELRQHLEFIILLRPSEYQPRTEDLDASNSVSLEPHPEKGVASILDTFATSSITGLASSKLNEIQVRLIEANLRRRHRFLLAQRRSQHAKERQTTEANKDSGDREQLASIRVEIDESHMRTEAPTPMSRPKQKRRAPMDTGLSIPSTATSSIRFPPSEKHIPKTAISQITSIHAAGEFPKPPRVVPGRLVTKCPCCCQSLPIDVTTNPSAWREHLAEDLCPYTCIAEHCPAPHLTFTSRKEWEIHFEEDHPFQWHCLMCDEDVIFQTRDNMEKHVDATHQDALVTHSLADIVSWSAVQTIGIQNCPLCSSSGPEDSPELVDHVIRHAYEFSLRALPWPYVDPEDLKKPVATYNIPKNSEYANRLLTWVYSTSSNSRKGLQLSPVDDHHNMFSPMTSSIADPDSNYFAENEYFQIESQENSSRAQETARSRSRTRTLQTDDDFVKIRNWLSPPDPSTNFNNARNKHHKGQKPMRFTNYVEVVNADQIFQRYAISSNFSMYSERPLTVSEGVDAIAVDTGNQPRFDPENRMSFPGEIIRCCSGLIILNQRETEKMNDSRDGIQTITEIQLAHSTVLDYLMSDSWGTNELHSLQESTAELIIVDVCLSYLQELNHSYTLEEARQKYPLAQYSARYWAKHAAILENANKAVSPVVEEYFSFQPAFEFGYQLYRPDRPWEETPDEMIEPVSLLYYASVCGLL
ncbi:hypothetical protein PG985_002384 [Apiospora marii]|uniref:uncharacterized protein n=1 Tax=Apiospora marii TaxID=335849 RepID=UPI00312DF24F